LLVRLGLSFGRAYSKDFLIIHTWRAREREPITGVWGPSHPPPGGGQGQSHPEAGEVFVFKTVIFNGFAAVLHKMVYNLYF